MSFPRYEKYKSSGTEWLGEVPAHWEIKRSRRLFRQRNERARDSDEQLTASQRHGIVLQLAFMQAEGRAVVRVIHGADILKHVEPNDFVISMRSFQGGLEWSSLRGCISSAYVMLVPNERVNVNFFRYLFKCEPYIQALQSTSNLVRDGQAMRYENFTQVDLPLPTSTEQEIIGNFLDHETAKIDALIEEQRRLITLLKEKRQAIISHAVTNGDDSNVPTKDSGIGWLGAIPEKWSVLSLKALSSLISKGTTPTTVGGQFTASGVRFLKAENISDGQVQRHPEFFISTESHDILRRSALAKNDVLVVIAGATTGKSAVLSESLLPANTNQAVSFVRLKNPHFAHYVHFWLSTNAVQQSLLVNAVQSAQPNLSMGDLGSLPVVVPPISDAERIVEHLTNLLSRFNELGQAATALVTLLQERRSALISAAVTGEIDVRNWTPKQTEVFEELYEPA